MNLIEIKDIKKNFGSTQVLRGINFKFSEGEHWVLTGSSGSGKSTLLYLIGGLDTASSGKIFVENKDLSLLSDEVLANYRNKFIGFVFQFHYLLPSMNCMNNILLPARIGGVVEGPVKDHIMCYAERLGVEKLLTKYPYQLSGGEQQRINLLRAISLRPKLLLCDEPTGNLDSTNSQIVVKLLKELSLELGATLLIVTHDENVAGNFSNRIKMVDGRLVQ
ncbi:MAG: ABC transporter ATP-binding protein [Bacteriovoracaceae bacterium]|jgi:lipoprotein-releasing system ATP-binding protein|nr:ABC transporter ATP-binding protein [Bacteriovoracaceae bacterium]